MHEMKWEEIYDKFIKYFVERGHKEVPSSSIIPVGDPTLLFTSAGMVQFKRVFAGLEKRGYSRAVTIQKCFRMTDIDKIGETLRHHTFFLMMGNFSFGDYFKREAIEWGWDCLTNYYGIDERKLLVTVYKDDEEAYKLWSEHMGLSSQRIYKLGEKDNFWGPAGDTGACGPSSEIYYDLGEEYGCGKRDCKPGCDCDRFFEVWNLVFPQYNKTETGELKPLPKPGIDTGMGFERLAMILQGTFDPYTTDMFRPIIESLSHLTGIDYTNENIKTVRVIIDHIRALTFALSEGIMPSNEGRGYVMRRLIRRAMLRGRMAGVEKPFLNQLIPSVVGIYGGRYPELKSAEESIINIVKGEEEMFNQTLSTGLERFERIVEEAKRENRDCLSGEEAFQLYDTYGFPIEMTVDIAATYRYSVDVEGFKREMEKQRQRSRVGLGLQHRGTIMDTMMNFKGYECYRSQGRVLGVIIGDEEVEKAREGNRAGIIVSPTPFYPGGGGQVNDTGSISKGKSILRVEECQIREDGNILHIGEVLRGDFKVGDEVVGEIDVDKRRETERHHTATHLLHYALRQVFGEEVKQSGSYVNSERLRFDYTIGRQPTREELLEVEQLVNEKILSDDEVSYSFKLLKEAHKEGVIALFEDKYGEVVRVLSIGDYSKELCGGTHVRRTGEIGSFYILSDSAVSAGVRRIEAVCGLSAVRYSKEVEEVVRKASMFLNTTPDGVVDRIKVLKDEVKRLERRLSALTSRLGMDLISEIESSKKEIKGVIFYGVALDDLDDNALRNLIDRFKDRYSNTAMVIALVSTVDNRVKIFIGCTREAIGRGLKAGDIARVGAEVCGGGGGGRDDFAQAGGKDTSKVDDAIERIRAFIGEKVTYDITD
ncbi:MAG TPA: alanine--tRNA ligase [Firmicutes bacterium]|nr:alanine--tRNA ligase [Bacillota bacterium]